MNRHQMLALEGLTEHKAKKVSIQASTDFETALGEDLPSRSGGMLITNASENTVYIQFDGSDADTSAFPLYPRGTYATAGNRPTLQEYRLFAETASDVVLVPCTLIEEI